MSRFSNGQASIRLILHEPKREDRITEMGEKKKRKEKKNPQKSKDILLLKLSEGIFLVIRREKLWASTAAALVILFVESIIYLQTHLFESTKLPL